MGTYSKTFLSVLHYFLRVIFEVMYVGLLHYDFVTLCRNYSHLILEHVCNDIDTFEGFYWNIQVWPLWWLWLVVVLYYIILWHYDCVLEAFQKTVNCNYFRHHYQPYCWCFDKIRAMKNDENPQRHQNHLWFYFVWKTQSFGLRDKLC